MAQSKRPVSDNTKDLAVRIGFLAEGLDYQLSAVRDLSSAVRHLTDTISVLVDSQRELADRIERVRVRQKLALRREK